VVSLFARVVARVSEGFVRAFARAVARVCEGLHGVLGLRAFDWVC
jgi:hypothetical protein